MDFDFDFARRTSWIKHIGKTQLEIDPEFKKKLGVLRMELYEKKVSGAEFWETYKKILLKSVGKDKKILQDLLKKTDSKIKKQFKEAEVVEKANPKKVLIDLSLPK